MSHTGGKMEPYQGVWEQMGLRKNVDLFSRIFSWLDGLRMSLSQGQGAVPKDATGRTVGSTQSLIKFMFKIFCFGFKFDLFSGDIY